jgi:hypothetical protein
MNDSLEEKAAEAAKLKYRDFFPIIGLPLYRYRNLAYDTKENLDKSFVQQINNIAILSMYNMSLVIFPMYFYKESLGI